MLRARSCTLLVSLALLAPSVGAQPGPRTGTFQGRLSDPTTGAAVAGATVEIIALGVRRLADSSGRFVLRAIPVGRYVARIRRLGYVEVTDTIGVSVTDSVEHAFTLRPIPQELEQVLISGEPVTFPRFFEAAYKRAARAKGYFFTREDILAWNAKDFEILLNRIPGVYANDRGVTFQRCQLGLDALNPGSPKPKVAVYLDGSRVMIGANDTTGIYSLLGSVRPHQIQIMEVYPGVATIPAEFLADACAVIVIWTKRD